jgi:hypothetical protein
VADDASVPGGGGGDGGGEELKTIMQRGLGGKGRGRRESVCMWWEVAAAEDGESLVHFDIATTASSA